MSFILDQLKKSGKKRQLELAMRSKAETRSRETAGASQTDVQPMSGPMITKRSHLSAVVPGSCFFLRTGRLSSVTRKPRQPAGACRLHEGAGVYSGDLRAEGRECQAGVCIAG